MTDKLTREQRHHCMAHHRIVGMPAEAEDTRSYTGRAGASATQDLYRQLAPTQGSNIRF